MPRALLLPLQGQDLWADAEINASRFRFFHPGTVCVKSPTPAGVVGTAHGG